MTRFLVTAVMISLLVGAFTYALVWAQQEDKKNRIERATKALDAIAKQNIDEKNKRAVSRGFAHYDRLTAEIVWDNEDVRFVIYGGNAEENTNEE